MKTYIEINRENLVHNLTQLWKLTENIPVMFVVKANAYGHGLKEIVTIAKDLPFIHYYAVDSVEEALLVRSIDKHKKIVVIGWADNDQLKEMITNEIEFVCPSVNYLEDVETLSQELKKAAKVHLKVETGTSRMGMEPSEALEIINRTDKNLRLRNIHIIALYSHFANIEDTTDHSYAEHQMAIFSKLLNQLGPKEKNLLKHFSCSASTLLFPRTHFDIVRIGISAYGFWPSTATYISYIEKKKPAFQLKPVLSWYSRVAQVKWLEKGEAVGYGLTYRSFTRSRIIVVPVGYYDGYDRKLSDLAIIMVNGIKAPVRGRICMNMFMADVTHLEEVKAGDPVILIGSHNKETITADQLAEICGSISYEVVARINPLIPRKII